MKILFLKKEKRIEEIQSKVNYEEISEKKTTRLGYFLLFAMIVFTLWQAQGFITFLRNQISDPKEVSSCSFHLKSYIKNQNIDDRYSSNYDDFLIGDSCDYNPSELNVGIPKLMKSIRPRFIVLKAISDTLQQLTDKKYKFETSLQEEKANYENSLIEKIAKEKNKIYEKEAIKLKIVNFEKRIEEINQKITKANQSINSLNAEIGNFATKNESVILKPFQDYDTEYKIASFKKVLLLLAFFTPIFVFSLRKYIRSKKSNSKNTIIWGALVVIFSLLFAQIFFEFIYSIVPHILFQKIVTFLEQFAFIAIIGRYLLLLSIPILFGWIVFLIQKRVYNTEAVRMRAFKAGKCPKCEMKIDTEMNHCPVCAYKLKIKCAACAEMTLAIGEFCQKCGCSKSN
jgi:membrane-associated HD superfamily phosphohydrolase